MAGAQIRHLETTVRGRYLLRPAEGGARAPLLLGFHGYAEDAGAHLSALEAIPGIDDWHVVAVQGLNRFYTRSGEVVASWMTRQDRELAISDNLVWVRSVLAAVRTELVVSGPLAASGFSQGTAMAWRAAALALEGCAGVIALAGDIPPELADEAWISRPRALLGRGDADAWYTVDKLAADVALLSGLGLEVHRSEFVGGHVWTEPFRAAAGGFLARLRQV